MTNREPDSIADEWLVFRAQEGCGRALEELLKRWRKRLWLHAVRVVGNAEAAQDVVQESLLAIAAGVRRLDDPSRFPGWAYRIVTFKGRDWIRQQVRRRRLNAEIQAESEVDSVVVESSEESRRCDLKEALDCLPDRQRELLRLRYHLGLGLTEIAEMEAVPVGTVKSRLFLARSTLKRFLNQNQDR